MPVRPLVSLILAVKNGMPHVQKAIEAIERQTYTDCELIVQDGASTDGTFEYLSSRTGIRRLRLESSADAGVGDAYNRAFVRCSGDLICFVASDEYLEDDAIERGVALFARFPDAVLINGAVRLIDANDESIQVFEAPHFDLMSHLRCETVLPFAGLLDRARIGPDGFFDASLKTCPDYDFWIRLGSRFEPDRFVTVKEVFKTARADRASMSFRSESFGQFCRDKTFVLNRFLDAQPPGPVIEAVRRSAMSGIYLWAAESVFALEGPSSHFLEWCREAATFDPWSPRLQRLATRSHAFHIDEMTGRMIVTDARQPDQPTCSTTAVGTLDLEKTISRTHRSGSHVQRGPAVVVQTAAESWAYAAKIPVPIALLADTGGWYWARVDLEVLVGQIGVGLLIGDELRDEHLIPPSQGRTIAFLKITHAGGSILIRNGALNVVSTVRIFKVVIVRCPK